jgi:hypothetical protein
VRSPVLLTHRFIAKDVKKVRISPFTVGLLATVALPLTLTACASGSTAGSAAAGKRSPAATALTATQSPADPDAGLLTGAQLAAALAPASFFSKGYALDASGSVDTGDTYQTQSVSPVVAPDCTLLDGTSWIAMTGFGGASFAENDYIDKDDSQEAAQEIDVFQGSAAQTALAAIGKIAKICRSFRDSQTSSTVRVAEKPMSGLGDGGFVITLTDPQWQTGMTLEALRVKSAVVTVLSSSNESVNGASLASKLASRIVGSLAGKA